MKATPIISKKTGEIVWIVRYRFKQNGKSRHSTTGQFSTASEALENARLLKEKKERLPLLTRHDDDPTVFSLLELFISYKKNKSESKTTARTTSDATIAKRASSIKNNYTPVVIGNERLSELTPTTFSRWVAFINEYPASCTLYNEKFQGKDGTLSGRTVRGFINTIRAFNNFLNENGYYKEKDQHFGADVLTSISLIRIKPKDEGARTDRHSLTVAEFDKITDYFVKQGLGSFVNMYWYTMFYVFMFTGLRVEELVALRWENFYKDDNKLVFHIKNAISALETKENVEERYRKGIEITKNSSSKRKISLFRIISSLMEDYKWDYKREFNIHTDEEMNSLFIFPAYNGAAKRFTVNDYQKHKNILRMLQKVTKAEGLPRTDVQMFRHAFAELLTFPESEGGLNYNPDDVNNYLGHSSSYEIRNTYAKMSERERFAKSNATFHDLIDYDATKADNSEERKAALELKERIRKNDTNNVYVREARKRKLKAQIERAIEKGQKDFEVHIGEALLLDEIIFEHIEETGDDFCERIRIYGNDGISKISEIDNSDEYNDEQKEKIKHIIWHLLLVNNRKRLDEALKSGEDVLLDKKWKFDVFAKLIDEDKDGKYNDVRFRVAENAQNYAISINDQHIQEFLARSNVFLK